MLLSGRKGGANYNNYRVKYDDRIQKGSLKLAGLPPNQGGGGSGTSVVTWREVSR